MHRLIRDRIWSIDCRVVIPSRRSRLRAQHVPNHSKHAVIERVFVSVPVGIKIILCTAESGAHEVDIEVEDLAAIELVDHPCKSDVLDLMVYKSATYVAVMTGKPALDEFGFYGFFGD